MTDEKEPCEECAKLRQEIEELKSRNERLADQLHTVNSYANRLEDELGELEWSMEHLP